MDNSFRFTQNLRVKNETKFNESFKYSHSFCNLYEKKMITENDFLEKFKCCLGKNFNPVCKTE